MKKTLLTIAALGFVAFNANAMEKIVITGQPYILEKQGDYYIAPQTFQATNPFQYVTLDGVPRACFLDKRPDFVNLDVVSINVQAGGQNATWNCYATDPTYFVIQGQ